MSFSLSSQNVYAYLCERELCDEFNFDPSKIELKPAKNFNLLLTLKTEQKLLVKQERYSKGGKTAGEFLKEWRVQELIDQFPELDSTRHLFPEVLHFDEENSITVFNYLDNYRDLGEFYAKEKTFPITIASELGSAIAKIHRLTMGKADYQTFLSSPEKKQDSSEQKTPAFVRGLGRISPDVFGVFPADGLKFLTLYQRYDSLGKSIAALSATYQPCCLTHNDLKLNNILLHNNWSEQISEPNPNEVLRLIDWERSSWGDPAFDLGSVVASYLSIWLGSLVISKDIALEDSLRMAMNPLELLQPSLGGLMSTYLNKFPEFLQQQPNFVQRTVQFAGLALIQQIQAMIQYQKVFNNTGICMLQVAKSFLCRPEQSIPTIFGQSEASLINNAQPELITTVKE
jgi:thiamine kinase-like enzyme